MEENVADAADNYGWTAGRPASCVPADAGTALYS